MICHLPSQWSAPSEMGKGGLALPGQFGDDVLVDPRTTDRHLNGASTCASACA